MSRFANLTPGFTVTCAEPEALTGEAQDDVAGAVSTTDEVGEAELVGEAEMVGAADVVGVALDVVAPSVSAGVLHEAELLSELAEVVVPPDDGELPGPPEVPSADHGCQILLSITWNLMPVGLVPPQVPPLMSTNALAET